MELSPDLDELVDRLWQRHPGFRRTTVARLVQRTAAQLRDTDRRSVRAVCESAAEQLAYVDAGLGIDPDGPNAT